MRCWYLLFHVLERRETYRKLGRATRLHQPKFEFALLSGRRLGHRVIESYSLRPSEAELRRSEVV
jgi:hypothetical protein